jgi:hypothetical protein
MREPECALIKIGRLHFAAELIRVALMDWTLLALIPVKPRMTLRERTATVEGLELGQVHIKTAQRKH